MSSAVIWSSVRLRGSTAVFQPVGDKIRIKPGYREASTLKLALSNEEARRRSNCQWHIVRYVIQVSSNGQEACFGARNRFQGRNNIGGPSAMRYEVGLMGQLE